MIEELTKSIKSHLYDKTSSPLFGAFFFSWCLWNFKLLMLILSSKDIEKKYNLIETLLYPSKYDYLNYWFILPLFTASIFIFIYPYPAKLVYHFWRTRQNELKTVRQNIDNEILLSAEESRKIKRELQSIEEAYDNTIKKKDLELKNLYKSLEESNKNNDTNQNTIAQLREQLNNINQAREGKEIDEQTQLLKILMDNNGQLSEDQLIKLLGWSKIKYDFQFKELSSQKAIGKGGTTPHNFITLEHEGKRQLALRGLL